MKLTDKIKLERPVIFFDLETTGINLETDQIVEIAVTKIYPNGDEEKKVRRVKPTIPISPEATDVHGITEQDVENEPTFSSISKSMKEFFDGSDIAGYNSNGFDVPILIKEFQRSGIEFDTTGILFIDIFNLERKLNSNDLSSVYKRYTGKTLDDAHSADADTNATVEIFMHQLERLDENVDLVDVDDFIQGDKRRVDISGKIYDVKGEWFWNFGKHKDKPLSENKSYIRWALSADFPYETKQKLKEYISNES
jgi:DNA polymerase-3 subunit epsilon